MFRLKNRPDVREEAVAYGTRRDFQEIFTKDMAGLHLLAFLLTADAHKAGQCFVAGLQSSIEGNPVFRQWTRAWSRRSIIKNAIKMVAPTPGQASTSPQMDGAKGSDPKANALISAVSRLIAAVTRLAAFERFVLVITVLEDYSAQECAELLGRSIEEVTTAKSQALKSLRSLSRLCGAGTLACAEAPSSTKASTGKSAGATKKGAQLDSAEAGLHLEVCVIP